jgi:predicted DNA-binding transcriptional regulator AlpA
VKPKPRRKFKRPVRHHLDRRAGQLLTTIKTTKADRLLMLSTHQVAELLGVSEQWLEVGRVKNYGPPFERLGPRLIRYPRAGLVKWLKQRQAVE